MLPDTASDWLDCIERAGDLHTVGLAKGEYGRLLLQWLRWKLSDRPGLLVHRLDAIEGRYAFGFSTAGREVPRDLLTGFPHQLLDEIARAGGPLGHRARSLLLELGDHKALPLETIARDPAEAPEHRLVAWRRIARYSTDAVVLRDASTALLYEEDVAYREPGTIALAMADILDGNWETGMPSLLDLLDRGPQWKPRIAEICVSPDPIGMALSVLRATFWVDIDTARARAVGLRDHMPAEHAWLLERRAPAPRPPAR